MTSAEMLSQQASIASISTPCPFPTRQDFRSPPEFAFDFISSSFFPPLADGQFEWVVCLSLDTAAVIQLNLNFDCTPGGLYIYILFCSPLPRLSAAKINKKHFISY